MRIGSWKMRSSVCSVFRSERPRAALGKTPGCGHAQSDEGRDFREVSGSPIRSQSIVAEQRFQRGRAAAEGLEKFHGVAAAAHFQNGGQEALAGVPVEQVGFLEGR